MRHAIDRAWSYLVGHHFDQAEGLLHKQNERDPLTQCLLARLEIARRQTPSALEVLKMLTQSNPDNVEVRVHLAAGLFAMGHRKAATEQAEHALHGGARHADLEVVLGADALRLGDVDEALACYDAALGQCPTYVAAWLGKARALTYTGAVGDAEAAYFRVVELAPQDPTAWRELIRLELNYGAHDAARQNFEAARGFLRRPEVLDEFAPHFVADDEPAEDGFWEELNDLLSSAEKRPAAVIEQVFAQLSTKWRDDERFAAVRAATALLLSQPAQMTRSIHALTQLVKDKQHRRWQTLWLLGALQLSDTPLFHPHLAVTYLEEAVKMAFDNRLVVETLQDGYRRAGRERLAEALTERVRAL